MTAICEAGFDFCEYGYQVGEMPRNMDSWRLTLTDNFQFMTLGQMEYWMNGIYYELTYSRKMSMEFADLLFTYERQISGRLNNTFYTQHNQLGMAVINWLHYSFVLPTCGRWVERWPRQDTSDIDAYLVTKAFETVSPLYDYDALQRYLLSPLGKNLYGISMVRNIARYSCGNFPGLTDVLMAKWLELLQSHGVDLKSYAIFEQRLLWEAPYIWNCCRKISVQLSYDDDVGLLIKVSNELRPEFSHLDPCYLCEPNCPRQANGPAMCLARVDESLRDIRLNSSLPGQWDEPLKPNQELVVQKCESWCGVELFDSVDEEYPVLELYTSELS
jgi:hypothetical protein